MVLLLSKNEVNSLLSMRECIDAVEEAFREFATGAATMPNRVSLPIPVQGGWLGVMPAYLARTGSLTTKIVTVYPQNLATHRIPNVLAVVLLNDVETGRIQAIIEGSQITAMRTGAVSGVATKYLARANSNRVGLFGAGGQSRKQLQAIREVRKIDSVKVYDTNKDLAKSFALEVLAEKTIAVSVASEPDEVVQNSDIIVTATTSPTPVFNGRLLRPGTHINAIGAYTPTAREVDSVTVSSSKIVVDSIEAALEEAGDILIPLKEGVLRRESIWGELGEVITGRKRGRTSEDETTLFKSVGLGIQDAAVAKLVFQKAQKFGVGTRFNFEK
jgi:ornithine cyclodeaminase/alanine dehydrogenase